MQKYRIYFIAVILVCFCNTVTKAQDSSHVIKPLFLHNSFYYDFPKSFGASAGVDFVLHSKIKNKTSKNGLQKANYRDLIVNADIGFYRYRFNNTGVFFIPSIGKRYYGNRPHYFEILLGTGVVRTFYDGLVYEVDDNGKVSIKNYYGRFYAMADIATTFGWDFEKEKYPKPFALQVKPVLWFQFPYNSFKLPHLSIEAGVKYHFKNYNTHVKQKQINHK